MMTFFDDQVRSLRRHKCLEVLQRFKFRVWYPRHRESCMESGLSMSSHYSTIGGTVRLIFNELNCQFPRQCQYHNFPRTYQRKVASNNLNHQFLLRINSIKYTLYEQLGTYRGGRVSSSKCRKTTSKDRHRMRFSDLCLTPKLRMETCDKGFEVLENINFVKVLPLSPDIPRQRIQANMRRPVGLRYEYKKKLTVNLIVFGFLY